ncbi:MAG: phosphodiester glycosidase family protein [Ardenticatenaceae bacterium]|nr:phosphodiester glycosidase family protein [Ardenticatenaceae bacterium]
MGLSKIRRLIELLIIFFAVFWLLPKQPARAYKTDTHAELNQLGAELVQLKDDKGLFAEIYLDQHIVQLRQGGVNEDEDDKNLDLDTCNTARPLKHFYHPNATDQNEAGLNVLDISTRELIRCMDAVTWARTSDNNRTWIGAIENYGYTPLEKESAYLALGHVAHLVGDLAQPDHVHLEPHVEHVPILDNYLPIPADPEANYESWVLKNWNLIQPSLEGLTPRKEETMEAHLVAMARYTYDSSNFQGGSLSRNIFRPIDPNLEFAQMFRIEYCPSPLDLANPASFCSLYKSWNEWTAYNKINGDSLGAWDGEYSPYAIVSPDQFWETRYEIDGNPEGYYYVENIVEAVPSEYKGVPNENCPLKDQAACPLAYFYAERMLPVAVEYIAGLYQLFHDIVNHPPYADSVLVLQAEKCLYHKHWQNNFNDNGSLVGRTLENDCIEPVAADVNGAPITIRISFRDGALSPPPSTIERVQDVEVRIGDVLIAGELDVNENVWSGSIAANELETISGIQAIAISAKDQQDHYADRTYSGDELDTNPATLAWVDSEFNGENSKANYQWHGYEPGTDTNHSIVVSGHEVEVTPCIINSTDNIELHAETEEGSDIYVVCIDLTDPQIRFETVMANDTNSVNPSVDQREAVVSIAEREPYSLRNPIVAFNADFFGVGHGPEGFTVKNGLRIDGSFSDDFDGNETNRVSQSISRVNWVELIHKSSGEVSDEILLLSRFYNSSGGGPTILQNGQIVLNPCEPEGFPISVCDTNRHTAVGISEDGQTYIIIAAESKTAMEMGQILQEYGAFTGINLSGGTTSQLWYQGKEVVSGSPVANAMVVFREEIPRHDALILEQSQFPVVQAGEPFTITIRLANTGFLPWESQLDYALQHVDHEQLGITSPIFLPQTTSVATHYDTTFTLKGIAPNTPGAYQSIWQLIYQDSQGFIEPIGEEVGFLVTVIPEGSSLDFGDSIQQLIDQFVAEIEGNIRDYLDGLQQEIEARIRAELLKMIPPELRCLFGLSLFMTNAWGLSSWRRKRGDNV